MPKFKTVWVMMDHHKCLCGAFDSLEAVLQQHPDKGLFVSHLVGGLYLGKDKDEAQPLRLFRNTLHHFTDADE